MENQGQKVGAAQLFLVFTIFSFSDLNKEKHDKLFMNKNQIT